MKTNNLDYNSKQLIISASLCSKILILIALFFSKSLYAQEADSVNVSGKILTTDNKPIAGAIIQVKGTPLVVKSETDGTYTIKAPKNAIIIVAASGYNPKEINISAIDALKEVKLTPTNATATNPDSSKLATPITDQQLNEVVVTGFGSSKKRDVTGAITRVDNTKLQDLPNTNPVQALRGTVAGLRAVPEPRPGAGAGIQIRGQNSITASNNALIVVDGIIFGDDVSKINPNDIESFDVLKDASSAAIYGARGANGVVIITTKRGKTKKAAIQFNAYAGAQDFDNNQQMESPQQYIEKVLNYNETLRFRGNNSIIVDRNDPQRIAQFLNEGERQNYLNGNATDGYEVISQNAPIQNYELNVSAATDKFNYYLSGAYTNQQGVVINDQFKRASVRLNLEANVTNWLKLGTNSNYSFRDYSGIKANLLDAFKISPYAPYYVDDAQTVLKFRPLAPDLLGNPLFPTRASDINQQNSLFSLLYAEADIPFIKGLSYRLNYSNNIGWNTNYFFSPSYKIPSEGVAIEANAVDRQEDTREIYLENILKYNRVFNKKHDVDVTLLFNYNKASSNGVRAEGNTFPSDDLGFYSLSLAENKQTIAFRNEYAGTALMARLNYKYSNKYLLTLTARQDGASVFGPDNKYGFFPSAALGWIVSEEKFFKKNKYLGFLKLRASYGIAGNQAITRYGSLSKIVNIDNYIYGDQAESAFGLGATSLGNPSLKWETTRSLNLGADFQLFNNTVSGNFDYYTSTTEDLLLNAAIPSLNGFNTFLTNVGELQNRGIELTLNSTNISTPNFQWVTGINVFYNKNKVVKLYGFDLDNNGVEDDDITNSLFIGQALGAVYDYTLDGVYQIGENIPQGFRAGDFRIRDINGDNVINPADRSVVGFNQPDYTFGFNTTITYKNFTLYALASAQLGGERDNVVINPTANNLPRNRYVVRNWWTPNNPTNTDPSIDYQNTFGHRYLESTDFLRIQDVTLSYRFGDKLMQKLKIGGLRVYVSAKNLSLFTNWSGWDPEQEVVGASTYPQFRTITGGLNLSF